MSTSSAVRSGSAGHTRWSTPAQVIDDFVVTRRAMNQSDAQLQNPVITATVNNGINAFILVQRRANYILPSRAQRAFPLLAGRESLT